MLNTVFPKIDGDQVPGSLKFGKKGNTKKKSKSSFTDWLFFVMNGRILLKFYELLKRAGVGCNFCLVLELKQRQKSCKIFDYFLENREKEEKFHLKSTFSSTNVSEQTKKRDETEVT